jgi:hypothetical protein
MVMLSRRAKLEVPKDERGRIDMGEAGEELGEGSPREDSSAVESVEVGDESSESETRDAAPL